MKLAKYTNRVILFCNLWFCAVIAFLMSNRQMFLPISEERYPGSDKLMNSTVVDLLVRKESLIIVAIIVGAIIFKERQFGVRYAARIWTNIALSILLTVMGGFLLSKLYSF